MKKFLKWIGIFIGIIFLLIILAIASAVIFINPDRFKPMIAERMTQMTGHPVTITGQLSWTLFPNIGIKVNHIILENSAEFKEKIFADIATATVNIKLFPLFKQKIESSGITLDGMKLNFIKNAKGNNNWDFTPTKKPATQSFASDNHLQKTPLVIVIAGVHVTNATMTWTDELKKQWIEVKNFELHAKDVSVVNPIPVTTRFDIQSPQFVGHVEATANVAANLPSQIFALKDLGLNIDSGKYHLHLTGDMTADLKRETFQWAPMQGNLGKLNFSGKISGTELKTAPNFRGHVMVDATDMRECLKDFGYDIQNLQAFHSVNGDFDFVFGSKPLMIDGKLTAGVIELNHVVLTNLILPTRYQNSLLTFSPITADFYQGTVDASATLALLNQKTMLEFTFNHFDVNALLKDLIPGKSKITFSGKGYLNASFKTEGFNSQDKIKNLNGQGKFRLDQGVLQGMDIPHLVNSAYAFIKKTPLTSSHTGETPFSELSGTFQIQNGIVSNQDLRMTAMQFSTTGQGTIDLPKQQIHYQLKTLINKATVEDKDSLLNLYGVAIPILISGDLQNPKIGLDPTEVSKIFADMQAKKIEVHIKNKLKGKKASEIINSLFGN